MPPFFYLPWVQNLLWITLFVAAALLVIRLARPLGRRLAGMNARRRRRPITTERQTTLAGLYADLIGLLAASIGLLAILSLFVSIDTLVWMVGLFSAAFGLGARPFISDVLTGLTFINENSFDVGDKVEMLDVEGVVERVFLRTTHVRSPSGELYILPNGDIRTIRNFSRGKFSLLRITLHIHSRHLDEALLQLDQLGNEAVVLLPNLIEPWQVLSEGDLGEKAQLTIVAKARFGKAAEMKPRLEALVQHRFDEAGISLV